MSWSYNASQLQTSPLYQVRFYIGDTNSAVQLLQDEEIAFILTSKPNPRLAAAVACDQLATLSAQQVDASAGDLSASNSQKSEAFAKRAAALRRAAGVYALPVFGGISIDKKRQLDQDTDLVPPSFRIGEDEYPGLPKSEAPTPASPFWWQK